MVADLHDKNSKSFLLSKNFSPNPELKTRKVALHLGELHRSVGDVSSEQKQMPNRRIFLVYLVFTRSLETQPHTDGAANLDDRQGRPTPSDSRRQLVIGFWTFIKIQKK